MLESSYELSLISFMSLYDSKNWQLNRFSEIFSQILAIILLITIIGTLIYLVKKISVMQNKEISNEKKTGFKGLFSNFKQNRKAPLYFDVIFIIRRLVLTFTCIMINKGPTAQIYIYFIASSVYLAYLINFLPFEASSMNW